MKIIYLNEDKPSPEARGKVFSKKQITFFKFNDDSNFCNNVFNFIFGILLKYNYF